MRETDTIVAIDTMALIWGLRQKGPADKCGRAKHLFALFSEENTQVIVSTVTVAEYLTYYAKSVHDDVVKSLDKRFHLKQFDEACASDAAHLFEFGKQMRTSGDEGGRAILRADTMIIATASAYGATTIYSADKNFRDLAQKIMRPADLPNPAGPLFNRSNG